MNRMLAVVVLCIMSAGCSVVMATQQPDKKDLTFLQKGTPIETVHANLGAPMAITEKDGCTTETYRFKQGYSKGAKAGRAFFHGAADILTCGLWEVVGTPVETIADGKDVTVVVAYDHESKIETVQITGD